MEAPLTIAELRELERLFNSGRGLFPGELSVALCAVRELIAIREAAEALRDKLAAIREKSQDKPTWEQEFLALRAALEEKDQPH